MGIVEEEAREMDRPEKLDQTYPSAVSRVNFQIFRHRRSGDPCPDTAPMGRSKGRWGMNAPPV